MYGPNYAKLSRVLAVKLFSMFIAHYTALPPARSDPRWPHSHAITASIRLALARTLQHRQGVYYVAAPPSAPLLELAPLALLPFLVSSGL
jgi:hypothetical protein